MKMMIKKLVIAGFMAMLPGALFAAGGSNVDLEYLEVKLGDKRALQSGAGIFMNYCLSCHSAQYMRYNRMAEDLGLTEEQVKKNMIFSDAKIGDPMTTTMTKEDGEAWFGVAPPDLTLVARLRGADWLYSYFKGFYRDSESITGWNNTVFPNVAMPHVMHAMQDTASEEEFDQAMSDLTHFLVYMGEPSKLVRIKYGIAVLCFLGLFGFLAFLLKKEYWRDVH